jgi:hypothetical protein
MASSLPLNEVQDSEIYSKGIQEFSSYSLLTLGGKLAGLFLYGQEPDPPPYPLTKETAADLLGDIFQLVHTYPVAESVPGVSRHGTLAGVEEARLLTPSIVRMRRTIILARLP